MSARLVWLTTSRWLPQMAIAVHPVSKAIDCCGSVRGCYWLAARQLNRAHTGDRHGFVAAQSAEEATGTVALTLHLHHQSPRQRVLRQ